MAELKPETSAGGFTFKRFTRSGQGLKRKYTDDDSGFSSKPKPSLSMDLDLDPKKNRFNMNVYKELRAIEQIFEDEKILFNIFKYLDDITLRSCVQVSLLFHTIGQFEILRRCDLYPCLRLSTSPHEIPGKDLNILSHIGGNLQRKKNVNYPETLPEFQAILTFGTENFEDGFNETEEDELPHNSIAFMYILSNDLVITKPDFTKTGPHEKLLKNPSVFQSLCIPRSSSLRIEGFFIPACSLRSEYDDLEVSKQLKTLWLGACMEVAYEFGYSSLENSQEYSSSLFKGLLLFEYGSNEFADRLIVEKINEAQSPNKVLVAGGQFNSLGCNYAESTLTPMCIGWKIYGNSTVKVESFRVTLNDTDDYLKIATIFINREEEYASRRGFAILLMNNQPDPNFKPKRGVKRIARENLPFFFSDLFRRHFLRIPLIGLGTSGYLIHKGKLKTYKEDFKYPLDLPLKASPDTACVLFLVTYP